MTPEDIDDLFKRKSCQGEEGSNATSQEKDFRTARLENVLEYLQHEKASGSLRLISITEKLGDGARDASWRLPLGESGILSFFLSILPETELQEILTLPALRVIGNSCADTDENRARVVQSGRIKTLTSLLEDDSLLPFLIPAIYNICLDYEPAQLEASKAGLGPELVKLISGPRLGEVLPLLNTICSILSLLLTQEPELELADPATPIHLLTVATNARFPLDSEDFTSLLSLSLSYLTHERFQQHILSTGQVDTLVQALEYFYTHFDYTPDPEETESMKRVQLAALSLLADLSAHDLFNANHPLTHPVVSRLISWLGLISSPDLQTAACLALGNISRSDERSTTLLPLVLPTLRSLLTSCPLPKGQLLHALLSFLKNLSIPLGNKPTIGTLLLEPTSTAILPSIWETTDVQPQTQFAAVSLTRLLTTNCPENVRRLITPLTSADSRTNLDLLASLIDRADAEPTKFEGARTVVAVCRVLHSDRHTTPIEKESFYTHHKDVISDSLNMLLSQSKFPALRSEALFTMALISRSNDGAKAVSAALEPSSVFQTLQDMIRKQADRFEPEDSRMEEADATGEKGLEDAMQRLQGLEPKQVDPAQAANMARIDRENGLVLVAELLKQGEAMLPEERRSKLEEMLREGGQLVMTEREL